MPKTTTCMAATQAAPLIGKVLRELFKEEPKEKEKKRKKRRGESAAPDEETVDGVPVRRAEPVRPDEQ